MGKSDNGKSDNGKADNRKADNRKAAKAKGKAKAGKGATTKADRAPGRAAGAAEPSEPAVPAALLNSEGLLRKSAFEEALEPLAVELNAMARWLQSSGRRVAVLIEGRDTAGKGGVISAIADTLSPRQCRVVALPRPSERETTQWYFQRYVPHLPAAGEIVLFDRSWYNRAGVERVMAFATESQVAAFLRDAPRFEQLLIDDGLLLFKYWLTVDQAQQEARFAERAADPLKRWKLSPIDLKARERYAQYTEARQAMLDATHTPAAPWTLVDFNDQRLGRLTLIRDLLDRIPDEPVADSPVVFPKLKGPPLTETFAAGLRPLPPYRWS